MSEVSRIVDQIQRACQGPAWHGPALSKILAGVTWQMAAQRPIPDAHSIWELVLHITVWMSVATRRLQGARIPTLPPAEDWRAAAAPDESGWRQVLDGLAQAQADLEAEVRKMSDDRLDETVLGDVPSSIYTMLHGVVQHNLYHAGQIAVLLKAVR